MVYDAPQRNFGREMSWSSLLSCRRHCSRGTEKLKGAKVVSAEGLRVDVELSLGLV